MKHLLVFCLLACGLEAAGQALSLPIDSASGRVVYRGMVTNGDTSADALFARAKSFGLTSLSPAQIDAEHKTVAGLWEQPLGSGRTLRYTATVRVLGSGYSYELTDFENKTADVQHFTNGVSATAKGGVAPIERVLKNPDGYRKGRPLPELVAYRSAVSKAAEQAVADLRQRMKP